MTLAAYSQGDIVELADGREVYVSLRVGDAVFVNSTSAPPRTGPWSMPATTEAALVRRYEATRQLGGSAIDFDPLRGGQDG